MKTTNNVRKATLKTVAVATGMALLSISVNAQEAFNLSLENNGSANYALATVKISQSGNIGNYDNFNFTNAGTYASYLVSETEKTLEIENWMTDESNFTGTESATAIAKKYLATKTEETLEVENWMVNEKTFEGSKTEKQTVIVTVAPKVFSTKTFFYTEVNNEVPLLVEGWMVNPKIWVK